MSPRRIRRERSGPPAPVPGPERVEIACAGGHGRTGTALACLAVLDGVPGHEAVRYVRTHYAARSVETPGQRRFVARFPPSQ